MFFAPQPRFRIYTKISYYFRVFFSIIFFRSNRGNSVHELEKTLKSNFDVDYVIAMPMARTAIYYAVKSVIKPGQKVLLSPVTIVDVVNMVICAGGLPVFVDVEVETCNIDAKKIKPLLDETVGAVLVTHLHGLACDIKQISELCCARGVPLIEDAAQAFGAKVDGRYVGTFGDVGIFSFGMYKNILGFYGGALLTRSEQTEASIRENMRRLPLFSLSLYIKKVFSGFSTEMATMPVVFQGFTFWVFRFGYLHNISAINGAVTVDRFPKRVDIMPEVFLRQMRSLQASLILSGLSRVSPDNIERIKAAHMYYEGLKDLDELVLPPLKKDGSHIYTYFPIQYKDRHKLVRFGMRHRRDWVLSHYHNCAALKCFEEFYRDCPDADKVSNRLIYLPTYPRYNKSEIKKNIEVIREFFGQSMSSRNRSSD